VIIIFLPEVQQRPARVPAEDLRLFSAEDHKHFPTRTRILCMWCLGEEPWATRAPEHPQWAQLTQHSGRDTTAVDPPPFASG